MDKFRGEYIATYEKKNRITIPADFRKILKNNFIWCLFDEEKILCLPEYFYNKIEKSKSLEQNPMLNLVHYSALKVNIDKQGRLKLKKKFDKFKENLEEKIVKIVGHGNFFGIWNPAVYDEIGLKSKREYFATFLKP